MPKRGLAVRAATAALLAGALSACQPTAPTGEAEPRPETASPESARPTGAEPSAASPGPADDAGTDEDAETRPPRRSSDPQGPTLEPDPEPPKPPGPQGAPLPEVVAERPDWLGERPLPERADGHGEAQPTPAELADRRLATPDPPEGVSPPSDAGFEATVEPVPEAVAARSTWHEDCPVGLDDLRYLNVTFWGFDERAHTGELLVHRRTADDLVEVFERLYEARFPIEEMRVMAAAELDAPPTGDGNNTTAFVCRDIAGGSGSWSQHAYGLAIDINPFHNPYERDDLVIPELAEAYLDRDDDRPGMIQPGDVATAAFADIGWGWGGEWRSLDDWMHFSESGL